MANQKFALEQSINHLLDETEKEIKMRSSLLESLLIPAFKGKIDISIRSIF